ncbi:uncharacterized protein LOC111368983 [Olea europaea var. sylvestris]|uniref:uncharacterized protein LOC111368983 n=1 Tax=Olea europaea var. sylvestris TaxID=158386 RepID=UPI000C1D0348|nr:uncharacterized protein LOC111368983 [Olea europaea var. sylvestris]
MKDLGIANKILGMKTLRGRRANRLYLSQSGTLRSCFNVELLIYTMICTRPNLVHAFSAVSRYNLIQGILIRKDHLQGMFTFGDHTISWKVTLQNTIVLSTIETEYITIIDACKEAMWLMGLIGEIIKDLQIFTTKHIDVKYRFLHNMTVHGDITVNKVDTKDNHNLIKGEDLL